MRSSLWGNIQTIRQHRDLYTLLSYCAYLISKGEKHSDKLSAGEVVDHWISSTLLVGVQTGRTTFERSLPLFIKVEGTIPSTLSLNHKYLFMTLQQRVLLINT